MAAPFPPQGNQKQHTERPLKIYGEQYLDGQPLPIGVVVDPAPAPGLPPIFSDGQPRVLLPTGWVVVHLTEFLISSRFTGKPIEVISDEEFTERFGPNLAEGGV
jgi:hypothetical protein